MNPDPKLLFLNATKKTGRAYLTPAPLTLNWLANAEKKKLAFAKRKRKRMSSLLCLEGIFRSLK